MNIIVSQISSVFSVFIFFEVPLKWDSDKLYQILMSKLWKNSCLSHLSRSKNWVVSYAFINAHAQLKVIYFKHCDPYFLHSLPDGILWLRLDTLPKYKKPWSKWNKHRIPLKWLDIFCVLSEGVQFFKHNKFNCWLADWQKWQEPPFSFSRKKCLQVMVANIRLCKLSGHGLLCNPALWWITNCPIKWL